MKKSELLKSCILPNLRLEEAKRIGIPVLLVNEFFLVERDADVENIESFGKVINISRKVIQGFGKLCRSITIPGTPIRGTAVQLWTNQVHHISDDDFERHIGDMGNLEASLGSPFSSHDAIIWRNTHGYFEIYEARSIAVLETDQFTVDGKDVLREMRDMKSVGWVSPKDAARIGYPTAMPHKVECFHQKSYGQLKEIGIPIVISMSAYSSEGQPSHGLMEGSNSYFRSIAMPCAPHLDMTIDFGNEQYKLSESYKHMPEIGWRQAQGCYYVELVMNPGGTGSPEVKYEHFGREMEKAGWFTYQQMCAMGFPFA